MAAPILRRSGCSTHGDLFCPAERRWGGVLPQIPLAGTAEGMGARERATPDEGDRNNGGERREKMVAKNSHIFKKFCQFSYLYYFCI